MTMPSRVACASAPLAVLTVVVVLSAAPPLEAQRRVGPVAPAKSAPDMTSVRAELAAVLLQSRKYDQAAREYRALLARDSSSFEYRLGLARALAWGGHAREAEREARVLRAKHLEIATVDSLLRSVRDAMEPRSVEAAAWVAENPVYAPYRVALARALASERFGRRAAAQYDTLLMGTSLGPMPDALMLRRERARAYLDAGDLVRGAGALRDVLRASPGDTAVRHDLAVILSNGQWKAEGRAQYDTLLARTPTAQLYAERGRLRLATGDSLGAEADLLAALPLGARAPAFLMLGDFYRQRGDYGPARAMFRLALTKLSDQDTSREVVEAAIAQLAREERPVAAFTPAFGDDPGWHFTTDGVTDNLGVHYAASTLRRTGALGGDAARVGVAMLHQYLGERSDVRSIDLTAVGAEALLAGQVAYGPFLGRAGVEAGGLHLPQGRVIPIGTATAAAWVDAWELGLATSTGPAYPTLLTTTALRPLDGVDDALIEHSVSAMLGGPLAAMDVAITGQQTRLSDGNRRTTLEAFLRFPLTTGVYMVYSGSRIAFADRSARYWDPIDYVSHAAGLELASRATHGLAVAVRALPGAAWSTEAPPPPAPTRQSRAPNVPDNIRLTAFQLNGGGELTWRDPSWEGYAAVTYGRGRTGEYRRMEATLGVRILP
jgi:tetratricopeptide (TPR) repeat protein